MSVWGRDREHMRKLNMNLCLCTCMCRYHRSMSGVFLYQLHFGFWDKVSQWTLWSLPLARLAGQPILETLCPAIHLQHEAYRHKPPLLLFMWVLQIWTQIFMPTLTDQFLLQGLSDNHIHKELHYWQMGLNESDEKIIILSLWRKNQYMQRQINANWFLRAEYNLKPMGCIPSYVILT